MHLCIAIMSIFCSWCCSRLCSSEKSVNIYCASGRCRCYLSICAKCNVRSHITLLPINKAKISHTVLLCGQGLMDHECAIIPYTLYMDNLSNFPIYQMIKCRGIDLCQLCPRSFNLPKMFVWSSINLCLFLGDLR